MEVFHPLLFWLSQLGPQITKKLQTSLHLDTKSLKRILKSLTYLLTLLTYLVDKI